MKIKLIFKGILLWATTFLGVIYIAGIDSFFKASFLLGLGFLIILILFGYTCYKVISEDELEKITFIKYLGINCKEE